MEKKLYSVPCLEHLAFVAVYNDVKSSLVLCPNHRPEDMQLDYISSSSIATMFLSSNSVLNWIDNQLTKRLIGVMGTKIRQRLLDQYYDSLLGHWSDKEPRIGTPDVWPFLDCVLDDTIRELKIHASFPRTAPNPKLIRTIANRSPYLNSLSIDFILLKFMLPVKAINSFIVSLHFLPNLTSLSLTNFDENHKYALRYLGKCCPLLIRLAISEFDFKKIDILSIVLGEEMDKLFGSLGDVPMLDLDFLQILRAPTNCLSPFHSTLKHLELTEGLGRSKWIEPSVLAFALHHLPKLETFNVFHRTSEAISSLVDCYHRSRLASQSRTFEISCSIGQKIGFFSPPIDNIAFLPFSGRLNSLTELGFVSVLNPRVLKAVGLSCPSLKTVKFIQVEIDPPTHLSAAYYKRKKVDASTEHIKSIFDAGWPKLENIVLTEISPEMVNTILGAFAPGLKKINYDTCSFVDLNNLSGCLLLEDLRITHFSTLNYGKDGEKKLDLDIFLPNLKTLHSDACLGNLSHFFYREFKLLESVTLNCCNLGIKDLPKHPLLNCVNRWYSIPKMWPRLKSFHVRYCDELTTEMMSKIIPLLDKLQHVTLPSSVRESDPLTALSFKNQLENKCPPIVLDFSEHYHVIHGGRCPHYHFVPYEQYVPYVYTESDSEDDVYQSGPDV